MGRSKEMQMRENLIIKESEKCIYLEKYLEVLNNQKMVQYIHPGPIEPFSFFGRRLDKRCYDTVHITQNNFPALFPYLF